MTQDEIIEMARQAGFSGSVAKMWAIYFESFAKLAAAKEREACAMVCEELPAPNFYSDTDQSMWDITSMDCAEAIRARGQA